MSVIPIRKKFIMASCSTAMVTQVSPVEMVASIRLIGQVWATSFLVDVLLPTPAVLLSPT